MLALVNSKALFFFSSLNKYLFLIILANSEKVVLASYPETVSVPPVVFPNIFVFPMLIGFCPLLINTFLNIGLTEAIIGSPVFTLYLTVDSAIS